MAFLFKSKKNQDRALSSRDGPPSSQSSLQGATGRAPREEKGHHQRGTPTGSLHSIDKEGSMGSLGSAGSPDQAYGRARGQAGDPQLQPASTQQGQQQSSDLPVSLSS